MVAAPWMPVGGGCGARVRLLGRVVGPGSGDAFVIVVIVSVVIGIVVTVGLVTVALMVLVRAG